MKNSQSCAHVLDNSLNLVISRCCFADESHHCITGFSTLIEKIIHCLKSCVDGDDIIQRGNLHQGLG